MNADWIIKHLGLAPHPGEGGYFRETWRSVLKFPSGAAGGVYGGDRSAGTAIYFLLTPESFSALHRLATDEIFHFYLGDPVEILLLAPDGTGRVELLGPDLAAGQSPQVLVPAGFWQGLALAPGGAFALLGTTVAPGFDYADFALGEREELLQRYPDFRERIEYLTRG